MSAVNVTSSLVLFYYLPIYCFLCRYCYWWCKFYTIDKLIVYYLLLLFEYTLLECYDVNDVDVDDEHWFKLTYHYFLLHLFSQTFNKSWRKKFTQLIICDELPFHCIYFVSCGNAIKSIRSALLIILLLPSLLLIFWSTIPPYLFTFATCFLLILLSDNNWLKTRDSEAALQNVEPDWVSTINWGLANNT